MSDCSTAGGVFQTIVVVSVPVGSGWSVPDGGAVVSPGLPPEVSSVPSVDVVVPPSPGVGPVPGEVVPPVVPGPEVPGPLVLGSVVVPGPVVPGSVVPGSVGTGSVVLGPVVPGLVVPGSGDVEPPVVPGVPGVVVGPVVVDGEVTPAATTSYATIVRD
ncbi:hypothetical protein C8046_09095 [Serinibacter arcticus]|uniref:Uncharacterized protein n=1 Tax=Serinibacter arcticus TaxID=1655435 RepID=A0A2U1ZUX7_9MICO|nr:hypothetical protein C8046_09095 [Serinibacter arcticus]